MGIETRPRKIQQLGNYSLYMAVPPDFLRSQDLSKGSEVVCVIESDCLKVYKKQNVQKQHNTDQSEQQTKTNTSINGNC